ncbi:MAG: hypothetical protein E7316_10540 [Clostridiales bacterium]|nr:hypothetical protein [Clostridiales bacterium]
MKLSQLTTDQLADVLIRLTPPLCRILRDEQALAALDELSFTGLDVQPPLLTLSRLWEKLVPLLLERHAADFYEALSILTGKPAEALRLQPGLATLADLMSVWDSQLASFFSCAGSAEQERS